MKFYSVRDLRTKTKEIQRTISEDEDAVLTNNGKPFAIMIPVDEEDYVATMDNLVRIRALSAMRRMQDMAEKAGISDMSLDEINRIIAETRAEMRES